MAKILIVDDDRQIVEKIGYRLQQAGHLCRGEASGERALEIIERGGVDMVVLDVMIPGLSGFEVCRRVRTNPNNFAMPILFVSAMDSEEEIKHGLAQGADDFVSKPFNLDQLMRRIDNLLVISANTALTDDITELPAAKAIKHDVQTAVNEKRTFSLVYAELTKSAEFGRAVGNEERLKALRHFARGLDLAVKQLNLTNANIGHLGSGHFLCLLDPGQGEAFCREASRVWEKHLPRFYRELGQEAAFVQARTATRTATRQATIPLLDAIFCATQHDPNVVTTVPELLDTLSNMRKGAVDGLGAGIFIDRRAEAPRARG